MLIVAIFLGIFGLFLLSNPSKVLASDCPGYDIYSQGDFFDNYERVEYVNGLLWIHFKLKSPSVGGQWMRDLEFLDDKCVRATVPYPQYVYGVYLSPGVKDWSIRFSSRTHYDIWNDETNTKEPCTSCSEDIGEFPLFDKFFYYAAAGASYFWSGAYYIVQPPISPPDKGVSLPTPAGCQPFETNNGYFFDNYEFTEYKDGKLIIHLRFKSPYNDGRPWYFKIYAYNENCQQIGSVEPYFLPLSVKSHSRYFSVHFTSPETFEIWNDETNTKENCSNCSYNFGNFNGTKPKYLSFYGSIDGQASNFSSTPLSPSEPLIEPACCSSVVFIPGIEASRLYKPGAFFENQLWEPNTNDDVRVLALDPTTGESVNAGIYTDDVIDEAFSVNIYKNFLSFMENLVTAGYIADFETFPYDWRLDVKDVVSRVVLLRSGSYEMIPRLREIAAASQTGKVTLVAHSNGGLVAKELLNSLKESGEENLVDRIILAATPELGTPKATLEMLHGMEPFAFNFPREEVTRELAENMKSAYALLPSAEYFNQLGAAARPIIEFSTTTDVTLSLRGIYGEAISNYENLRQFILGDNGARSEPSPAAVNLPNVLKEPFLTQAETRHGELDAWQPPAGIDVVRIIGWGLETPRGIVYKSAKRNVCNDDLSVCFVEEALDPEPLLTAEGDGTVVYLSADALGGERYYVNIKKYNEENFNRNHKSILEITPIQDLLATLVKKEATTTLPAFTSITKPDAGSIGEHLRIDVHSPVTLNLYDSLERHTGPIPNPAPLSDLELSEEQIPNSYYWRLGEGQYAGAGGAATTTVKLVGAALGAATVGIERIVGDGTIISGTLFEDIPITAGGTATIDVIPNAEPVMLLDVDGDGIVDAEITSDGLSSEALVAILKSLIKTLDLPDKKEKQIFKVIDKLEKELAKEHKKEKVEKLKTEQAFKHLIKLVEQYQKKKILSADEAGELVGLIESIRSKVVK